METCPLCSKEFKRLDLHLGTTHGKEVMALFKDKEVKENVEKERRVDTVGYRDNGMEEQSSQVRRELLQDDNKRNDRVPTAPSPLSSIREMQQEMMQSMQMQMQMQMLTQQMKQMNNTNVRDNDMLKMLEMQKSILETERQRSDNMRKEILANATKDDDGFQQLLMSMFMQGGALNVQPKPSSDGTSGDTSQVSYGTTTTPRGVSVITEADSPIGEPHTREV